MKRAIVILLALVLTLSLAACGGGKPQESPGGNADNSPAVSDGVQTITFGYSFANMDENNMRILKAYQEYVANFNEENKGVYDVKFIYTDAQSDVSKQLDDVESMITNGCDIITISAVDLEGSYAAAEAAHNAGVLVVEGGRGMRGDALDLYSDGKFDQVMSGMIKDYIIEYLEANPDVVLKYGIILGLASQVDQLDRRNYVYELAEEYPDRVKIVAEQYGNWSTDEAQSIAEDWMQLYGDEINAYCSASDDMALGICNVLNAAGKNFDDIIITSYDGTSIGLELISQGQLDISIQMDMTAICAIGFTFSVEKFLGNYDDGVYSYPRECFRVATIDTVEDLYQYA